MEDKIMLNENLKKYAELQEQLNSLKEQLDTLREDILVEMDELGVSDYTSEDNITAKVVEKQNKKYIDEISMIKYLEENNLNQFITKKVNAPLMNKELKKSLSLKESLGSYYNTSVTKSLTVK